MGRDNFGVRGIGGRIFQLGSVPIVLQGYIIGTLTLGERLDQGFVERLHEMLDSDLVVTLGDRALGSTLTVTAPDAARLADPTAGGGTAVDGVATGGIGQAGGGVVPAETRVVRLGSEEYVTDPQVIGRDQEGRPVVLHLVRSLTAVLAEPNRSLLVTLLGYGSLVVILAGLSASVVSRSVLRPLETLVAFMRSAAEIAGRVRRFDTAGAGPEVRLLGETFNRLMDSLEQHEQRLLQGARDQMLRVERLKESEKLAALGRMLSGAAHEINNPLTGVVGNIEMLLEQPALDDGVRKRLEHVRGEGRRIVTLVRNLLRVSRRDGGRKTTVDLNQVIRDTVALRRHDFERARITLALDLAPQPIPLQAREIELQQVFLNIINNAYDALRASRRRPMLGIASSDGPDRATITFTDTGPGMEHPDQVFEHFYTTKPVGQGTGLGLSIAHAIVEEHGGRITAENVSGGGARFTIMLPRDAAPPAPEPLPPSPPEHMPDARRPLPASVLVVDDEPVVLDLQLAILDGLGARAVAAGTGAEAIDVLGTRDFDLIVSDLTLPGGVTGEDLYDWIRTHRRSGTRGLLFVSGEIGTRSSFLERSGVRCLLKPFTMDEYVAALHEAWDELQTAA